MLLCKKKKKPDIVPPVQPIPAKPKITDRREVLPRDPYQRGGTNLRGHETLAGPSTQGRGQITARGSGAHATTGRAEHAVGTTVGSDAHKAGGSRRQQEANEANIQRQELAEAERLEREALAHRERAVAHGAHRANRYLGGDPRAGILQGDGSGGQRGCGTRRSGGPCDTSPGYRSQQQSGGPSCAGQCGRDSCNAKKRATTSARRPNV
ncbi:hypothetical protein BDN67DRAFT_634183 [Paxillus ammoniavirescens]|nr:hypothetical protein BDN67DRAFT_634183 [Paxillus ammoniavirescens]